MAVAAPLSGVLSDRIGSRLLATLGMLVLGVGLYLLSRLGPQSPLAMVTVGLMVAGLGTGVFISPNSSALMGTAPRHRQGVAASVLALARNVGMVLGVGLAGAIFTSVQSGREVSEAIYSATELGFAVAAVVAVVAAAIAAVRGRT
jgi:MFS family permease